MRLGMEDNEVIRYLKAFPPGNIYFISPREYFIRGFEYYREGRVSNIVWSEDYTILDAYVEGNRPYTVSF